MKVIICGAGRVGKGIAARLAAEGNTVTVIDVSPQLIRQITTEFDVRGIVGHGAYPDMLSRAGADSTEMIIAVTYSDEVNMMACQIAHSLFSVPTKVARVRAQNYLASSLNPGDEAYVITLAEHASRLLEIIGSTNQKARQIVIIGGGSIGAYVAGELEKIAGVRVRVIERDKARAEEAAEKLRKTVILNGDAMDAAIQEEAGVANAELVICLTDDDKTNLLSAVLAKKMGARRTVVLVNEASMQGVRVELGIDLIIDPRATTVSSILRHVRRGRILDVFSIDEGSAEVMEGEVLETSPLSGKRIDSVEIGEGIAIGAIIHDGRVLFPTPDVVVRPGDRLVLLAERGALKTVEQLFRVSMDYF